MNVVFFKVSVETYVTVCKKQLFIYLDMVMNQLIEKTMQCNNFDTWLHVCSMPFHMSEIETHEENRDNFKTCCTAV